MESNPPAYPPEAPPARKGLPTAAWVAIGLVVLLVLGGLAVGGFAVASVTSATSDHQAALKVLEQVRVHNNDIDAQLKAVPNFDSANLTGDNPDFAKFRADMAAYGGKVTTASNTVRADLSKLRAEDSLLKQRSNSPQALFSRSQYANDRKRVESLIDSFDAAGTVFGIMQNQIDFFVKFAEALNNFQLVFARADRNDYAGALSAYSQLDSSMQAITSAATGQYIPPQFKTFAAGFKTLSDDFKALLQAIQAGDDAAGQAAADKVKADAMALQDFDQAGFQKFETDLVTPYRTRYENGLKSAGFTVTT